MGILDKLNPLGWIGDAVGKAVDRLVPDQNKERDQKHERANKQADATIEGERNNFWTPRKILFGVLTVPVGLQFGVKPSVEWVAAAVGHPLTLPDIPIDAPLRLLMFLLGGVG